MTAIMRLNNKAEKLAHKARPIYFSLYKFFVGVGAVYKQFPLLCFFVYLQVSLLVGATTGGDPMSLTEIILFRLFGAAGGGPVEMSFDSVIAIAEGAALAVLAPFLWVYGQGLSLGAVMLGIASAVIMLLVCKLVLMGAVIILKAGKQG